MSLPGPKREVTILEVTISPDGKGGTSRKWTTKITTRGYLSGMRGYERVIALQPGTVSNKRLYLDYDSDTSTITEKDRATVGGTTYEIEYINNPGNQDKYLEIDLVEVATE